MSSKVVEANAGVHSLAMAVAVCSFLPSLGCLLMSVLHVSLSRAGDYTVGADRIEKGTLLRV